MQIQEKHAQLQPQDKFCTCSRKAIWLLSLILWKFSILNPGEKKKKKKKNKQTNINIHLKIYIHYPFCWFTVASFFFPPLKMILFSRNVIPHYPIKCIVNSMSTWVATFSSGSAGLNSQQSSITPRDYNKLNRPKKFTLK